MKPNFARSLNVSLFTFFRSSDFDVFHSGLLLQLLVHLNLSDLQQCPRPSASGVSPRLLLSSSFIYCTVSKLSFLSHICINFSILYFFLLRIFMSKMLRYLSALYNHIKRHLLVLLPSQPGYFNSLK